MAKKGQTWAVRKAKIDIRIPEALKEEIKAAAAREGTTFTKWIEKAIRAGLGAEREPGERRG